MIRLINRLQIACALVTTAATVAVACIGASPVVLVSMMCGSAVCWYCCD